MDIDAQISLLASVPNPDLSGIDGTHLAALAAEERRQSRVMMSLVLVSALFIGVGASMLPVGEAQASAVLFGPPPTLTPLVQMGRE